MSQASTNPFKYSDTNKRYYTYEYYLRKTFGEKCAKITLDCGFTCPNIDGTVGYGGCIYCGNGSQSINCRQVTDIKEQYRIGIENARKKWTVNKFIPYMQSYTNTHTSPEKLKETVNEIANFEGAVMLNIATRADCLENEKIQILNELSDKIPVTVELGLQSSKDNTAKIINRGHDYAAFVDCFKRLRKYAPKIKIAIHIINGLPDETYEDMMKTARDVSILHPDLVKIHLLHVIDFTRLATMYKNGEYTEMDREFYIKTVCDQIEILPPDTVIERLTGDGIADGLLAPLWSRKKTTVINDIDKELFNRKTYQGFSFSG
ncbi:MAG: TIGR01212 family radical SAM protein [Clostridia bacterium]|nr:TIGR01212 family radical SAM protein [Clostridia bacterium]